MLMIGIFLAIICHKVFSQDCCNSLGHGIYDPDYTQNCYVVVENLLNWYEAEFSCYQINGHLVASDTLCTNNFLTSILNSYTVNSSYWIGGAINHQHQWTWMLQNLTDGASIDRLYNDTRLLMCDRILFSLLLPISLINSILVIVLFVLAIIDRQRFHRNILILRLQVLYAFECVALSRLIMIIIDLFENLISPPNGSIAYYIWYYALIVSSYGSDFLRCCWVALCIERGVATYFKHEYEQKSFSVVAAVLTLLIHLITIGVTFVKLKFPFSDYTIFAVSILMDLAGCLSVFFIFHYNKFLLQTRYKLKFSERFQVDENLRILKFLRPYLIVGIVLTLFNTLIRVLVYQITALSWIASRIVNIYFLAFNIYIFAGVAYNTKLIILKNKKVNYFYNKLTKPLFGETYNRITPIAEDQRLKQNEAKIYFELLQSSWK